MNFHQNSLKLLLLLHFSIDSFETRYTCFLGQSPNFVLFRSLKFRFSDFFYEFSSNFHWNRYCSYNFQWIPLKLCTLIIYVSLHIFFSVFEICIFYIFHEFSSNSPWNRYCSYSFQWIPLQLGTLILWVSLHIFFADVSKFVFLYFFAEFSFKFHSNRYCSYNI